MYYELMSKISNHYYKRWSFVSQDWCPKYTCNVKCQLYVELPETYTFRSHFLLQGGGAISFKFHAHFLQVTAVTSCSVTAVISCSFPAVLQLWFHAQCYSCDFMLIHCSVTTVILCSFPVMSAMISWFPAALQLWFHAHLMSRIVIISYNITAVANTPSVQ